MYNRGTMNRLLQAILDLSKLLYTKDLFCRIHFLTLLPIYLKTYIDKIPWDHLPHFPCSCLFFITTSTFLPLPFHLTPMLRRQQIFYLSPELLYDSLLSLLRFRYFYLILKAFILIGLDVN